MEVTREAFNQVAPFMDTVVQRNSINAWMRHANRLKVHETFSAKSCLLELGCGSGDDALALAKRGTRVFAVDISEKMIAKAKEKAIAQNLEERAIFERSPSSALMSALDSSPWKKFDGAYANFSLAYERTLQPIVASVYEAVKPYGFFICTLPNRIVLSQVVLYGLQLRFRKFLNRFENPMLLDVYGHLVEYHAYSPWNVKESFKGFFELKELVGVPVFLPPTYLHSFYDKLGPLRGLLKQADSAMSSKFPWNYFGEHTLFKFQRAKAEKNR